MKFSAEREAILTPLQAIVGVVERRQTKPILANILIATNGSEVLFTASDSEVELIAKGFAAIQESGESTVPGRKFFDIVRALPEKSKVTIATELNKITIRSGKSRFTLATLPAIDFPTIQVNTSSQWITLPQVKLKWMLEKTHFAMAQQDVRHFLNGMLLELNDQELKVVATNGHRLALASLSLEDQISEHNKIILPRKGVLELQRVLGTEGNVKLAIGQNHIHVHMDGIQFTSKLVDGRFPDYSGVVPSHSLQVIKVSRSAVRAALQRVAILANERHYSIRLELKSNLMILQVHNPEQEEAEEEVEVINEGNEIEVGFNVNYLLDALNVIESDDIEMGFTYEDKSCLIQVPDMPGVKYVVMPMRL